MNHSVLTLSVMAAATLAAHRFVTPVGAVPAANAVCLGATRSLAASGAMVPVDVLGTTLVEASAPISAGAAVATTNDGRAVTHSTGAKVGIALQAATGAGQFIEVLLIPNA
jgi:hypothetical protein